MSRYDREGVFCGLRLEQTCWRGGQRPIVYPAATNRCNIAVMFLVDMTGSNKGWIYGVVREPRALLREALEVLGDRYPIYGFAGFTHKRGGLSRIKRFEATYDHRVPAHIIGVAPKDSTRMRVFVRHLTRKLLEQEACTRLVITLSDCRAGDQDG